MGMRRRRERGAGDSSMRQKIERGAAGSRRQKTDRGASGSTRQRLEGRSREWAPKERERRSREQAPEAGGVQLGVGARGERRAHVGAGTRSWEGRS